MEVFVPPHAPEFEREILGACMLDDKACAVAIEMLEPSRFYLGKHQEIFGAIRGLFSEGIPVNISTVGQEVEGGTSRLIDLTHEVASTANVRHHATVVNEKWISRQALTEIWRAAGEIKSGEGDVFDVLDRLQSDLSGLVVGRSKETHIRVAVEAARDRVVEWRRGEATDYAPSGFYSLDRTFGGFPVGELTTIAAHSGAGKTSLIAQSVATQALIQSRKEKPKAVLLFSCEMTAEQIVHRIASNWSKSDLTILRAGKASEYAYDVYSKNLAIIAGLPIHVDDEPSPTFAHITARCQQVALTDGLSFAAVDYDEKLSSEGDTEELRVSKIAQGLKNVAKRFAVPVVSLSQYSKDSERSYGMPQDVWLRYSGKKLQESALVLHWYWPAYWVETKAVDGSLVKNYDETDPTRGFLNCTKNRFGKTGKIVIRFDPTTTRFIDPGDPAPF